jgi:hypothetical protein
MGALEGFTANQIVSVANLTSIVNMLPALQVTTVSVNPASSGTLYQCQPAGGAQIVITLPVPTPFAVVGVKLDAQSGSVQVTHNASEYLLSPLGDTTFRTNTSITITNPDSYVILQSDGTNWHEIGSNVPISDQAVTAAVTTSDNTTSTSLTATLSTHSGPSVSLVTGQTCFVTLSCEAANGTTSDGALMAFAVSGATTIAATVAMAVGLQASGAGGQVVYTGATFLVNELTPGVNTFTANYQATGGGTATFTNRRITVYTG